MQMVKLRIPLDENPEGIAGELVWATPLKHGNYRIENYPIGTDEVNYRDIVKADYIDHVLTFRSVVIRPGFSEQLGGD